LLGRRSCGSLHCLDVIRPSVAVFSTRHVLYFHAVGWTRSVLPKTGPHGRAHCGRADDGAGNSTLRWTTTLCVPGGYYHCIAEKHINALQLRTDKRGLVVWLHGCPSVSAGRNAAGENALRVVLRFYPSIGSIITFGFAAVISARGTVRAAGSFCVGALFYGVPAGMHTANSPYARASLLSTVPSG